jgi:hypothetical protein
MNTVTPSVRTCGDDVPLPLTTIIPDDAVRRRVRVIRTGRLRASLIGSQLEYIYPLKLSGQVTSCRGGASRRELNISSLGTKDQPER